MKKALIISTLVIGLGLNVPAFANGYIVNGHAASEVEAHYLAAHGFEPGAWVVDGWGIGPDVATTNVLTASDTKQCRSSANVLPCR